jgi:hypothetical protein
MQTFPHQQHAQGVHGKEHRGFPLSDAAAGKVAMAQRLLIFFDCMSVEDDEESALDLA